MKRILIILFFIVLLAIVEMSGMSVFEYPPDFILVAVIAGTVIFGFSEMIGWTIAVGIICDLMFFSSLGVHVIIFSLVSYATSFFSKRFLLENRGLGYLTIILWVMAMTVFFKVGNSFFSHSLNFSVFRHFFGGITGKLFLNVLVFFFFFLFFNKLKKIHMRSAVNL